MTHLQVDRPEVQVLEASAELKSYRTYMTSGDTIPFELLSCIYTNITIVVFASLSKYPLQNESLAAHISRSFCRQLTFGLNPVSCRDPARHFVQKCIFCFFRYTHARHVVEIISDLNKCHL